MLCYVVLCYVMLCYAMLCYVVICIAPLTEGYRIQRRSQPDRQAKRKVFILRRDAGDIPCSITLRSAEGVSFKSASPLKQRPGFGIKKYRTKVQEDRSDQQSAADKRSE